MQFIMLCGISGSGKSTWAYHWATSEPRPNKVNIISSDAIREELYGDASIQRNHAKVFSLMLERTKRALDKKENVIYDATNLNEKRRIALLNELKDYECPKICAIFITDPAVCADRQEYRERQVPNEVIWKQVKQFQPPHKSEGWTDIYFYITKCKGFNVNKFLDLAKDFDQHNPHHKLTLADHCYKAFKHAAENNCGQMVRDAASWHDIGKLMTQTFDNNKVAHYYSHENVSAYYYLLLNAEDFSDDAFLTMGLRELYDTRVAHEYKLDVAWLIAHHMDFFKSKEYLDKVKKRVDPLLWERLNWLHECDLAAH